MSDPTAQLSMFEDREVTRLQLSLSGTIKDIDSQPTSELRHDEEVVLIIVGVVDYVGFPRGDLGGLTREQKVKVSEAYELSGFADPLPLLTKLREAVREVNEERYGIAVDPAVVAEVGASVDARLGASAVNGDAQ